MKEQKQAIQQESWILETLESVVPSKTEDVSSKLSLLNLSLPFS